jgi:hypothetical protein
MVRSDQGGLGEEDVKLVGALKNAHKFLSGKNLKVRGHLGDQDIDGE